ncbi:hypothetical protein [Spirosoma endophyticum]|uniref:YceI-like domain-containing protein n=1 Tax=Spirosoma endophyticum TaxID=662367 RepID=A0A1I2IH07_9BACT|nr:hypothetical protein [Spirosoma endophyticum]SFF40920.1 hypothetical protein SAMN05216167_1752 [Spirosoma endophyticum]
MQQTISFFLFLIISCASVSLCKAQDCKSITKLKSSTLITYVGIIDIPPDYNNTTKNKFFTVDLAKHVKTDTSFIFGLSIVAFDALTTSNLATVKLQFEGDSEIVKSSQSLNITPMSEGRAILSTHVGLTSNEILAIQNKSLMSITLANSKVIVPETMSKALREVARCLPNFW